MYGAPLLDRSPDQATLWTGRVTVDHLRQSSVKIGLRCACPRCSEVKLYRGFLKIYERCLACACYCPRINTDDRQAFFIILWYRALVLAVLFQLAVEPTIWVYFQIWIPVIVFAEVALMSPFRAWLTLQQYKHNAGDAYFTR